MCHDAAGNQRGSHVIAPVRCSFLLSILVVFAALGALAMTLAAHDAQAASYKKCALSETEQDRAGEKPTYNIKLEAMSVSCPTAKKVMKAFHRCRSMSGYRCTSKVLSRWTCTGTKGASTKLQFTGDFTCKAGSRRVKSRYVQNT
jgi:hypothetical protein